MLILTSIECVLFEYRWYTTYLGTCARIDLYLGSLIVIKQYYLYILSYITCVFNLE